MKLRKKVNQLKKKIKQNLTFIFPTMPKKAQVLEANGTLFEKSVKYYIQTGEWVKENTAAQENNYVKLQGNEVAETTISKRNSLVAKMRARDAFLEKCLSSGKYTENKFLVIQDPYLLSPLSALVLFQTKTKYKIKAVVKGKETGETIGNTDIFGITELSVNHRIPIIGLYPNKENDVYLYFFNESEKLCKTFVFQITTAPLPVVMDNTIVKLVKNQKPSAFPMTFVYGGDTHFPYAFDRAGDIRFYIARQPKPYGLHFLSNGHFLFAEKNVLMPSFSNPHSSQVLEMDILGRVHRVYNIENGLHHDANEILPGGNIIAAGSSLENSNEDMVIELDRITGKVVKKIKLGNIFDKTYQDGIDWVHLNTVSYDIKTDSILICCRNLHTVAKINWKTGELLWILCNPKFWKGTSMTDKLLTPVGKNLKKSGWFYQAHAAYFLEKTFSENPDIVYMIIYDNHWHKRRSVNFFDEDPHSFIRIYEINEKEHTVALWKSFPCEKSKIRSNGIFCEKQNRLFAMSGFLEPLIDGCTGAVNEYDFESGELLNQYLTKTSYYRAYELPMNYLELIKPMEQEKEYMLGTIREPQKIKMPDVSFSIPIPKRELFYSTEEIYYKGTKAERKKKYKKALEQETVPFDLEQDIANTTFSIVDNILYIKAVDHLLKRIYFLGESNYYMQDYSDTKQTNPGLFGRLFYAITIPLGKLEKDKYQIYLECERKLYNTEEYIEIRNNSELL